MVCVVYMQIVSRFAGNGYVYLRREKAPAFYKPLPAVSRSGRGSDLCASDRLPGGRKLDVYIRAERPDHLCICARLCHMYAVPDGCLRKADQSAEKAGGPYVDADLGGSGGCAVF